MSMSSAEGSPVRTSVWQEKEPVSKESGPASGPSLPASFASYDPDTSSWRTSDIYPTVDCPVFSKTWPTWGLMRSGRCFQLPPSVPATFARGSLLWPTPNAMGGTGYMSGSKRDVWRPTLESAVRMAPTGPPPLIRRSSLETSKLGVRTPVPRSEWASGVLNPRWTEWLMGFPVGWCSLSEPPSETP